jgi:hypothetical protein
MGAGTFAAEAAMRLTSSAVKFGLDWTICIRSGRSAPSMDSNRNRNVITSPMLLAHRLDNSVVSTDAVATDWNDAAMDDSTPHRV